MTSTFRPRTAIAFTAFAAFATYLLFTEHRAHLVGVLPYLILLACPFMHLFMHGGHHHHNHGARPVTARPSEVHATRGAGGTP